MMSTFGRILVRGYIAIGCSTSLISFYYNETNNIRECRKYSNKFHIDEMFFDPLVKSAFHGLLFPYFLPMWYLDSMTINDSKFRRYRYLSHFTDITQRSRDEKERMMKDTEIKTPWWLNRL